MEFLVGLDPRRSAEGLLGLLLDAIQADAAGLYEVRGERIVLCASRGYDQLDFEQADETWQDARISLLAGQIYTDATFALIPLARAGQVAGALYVSARPALNVDAQAIETLRPMLAKAVTSPDSRSPIENYLERTPTLEIEREQLLVQLKRNEWTIARVARLRGVSRVTIYSQMKRLGIRREKVLKVGRVKQGQEDST